MDAVQYFAMRAEKLCTVMDKVVYDRSVYNGRDVGRTDDEECTGEYNCRSSREREEMIIDERRLDEMGTGCGR